jgi:hypothetical protein
MAKVWSGFIWLRIGLVTDSCERRNGPSDPINAGNILAICAIVSLSERNQLSVVY